MTDSKALVDKLWNYCNVLRDDGLSYGDYVEQLTYLLFLKMAEEQHELGLPRVVPEDLDWPSLLKLSGKALEANPCRPVLPAAGASRPGRGPHQPPA